MTHTSHTLASLIRTQTHTIPLVVAISMNTTRNTAYVPLSGAKRCALAFNHTCLIWPSPISWLWHSLQQVPPTAAGRQLVAACQRYHQREHQHQQTCLLPLQVDQSCNRHSRGHTQFVWETYKAPNNRAKGATGSYLSAIFLNHQGTGLNANSLSAAALRNA